MFMYFMVFLFFLWVLARWFLFGIDEKYFSNVDCFFFLWNKFTLHVFSHKTNFHIEWIWMEQCFFPSSWWYDKKNCVYFLALAVFNCNAKPFIWAQVCTWIYWDFKHRLENWIYFLLYKNVFLPSSLNQNCLHRSYESLYEPKMSPINKLTITPHIIIQIWCAYLIYSL